MYFITYTINHMYAVSTIGNRAIGTTWITVGVLKVPSLNRKELIIKASGLPSCIVEGYIALKSKQEDEQFTTTTHLCCTHKIYAAS